MSPSKPPHPFFARQHIACVKATAVDEFPSGYESDNLAPCLPLHITQNMPVRSTASCSGMFGKLLAMIAHINLLFLGNRNVGVGCVRLQWAVGGMRM